MFFKEEEKKSVDALAVLEEIDDDLDELGIIFVKLDDQVKVKRNLASKFLSISKAEAAEYGIESFPRLVVFENGIPNLYEGNLDYGDKIMEWIIAESSGDNTIEIVTDNMLDTIVANNDHVAVVFYKKEEEESDRFISMLEHIDDEANENSVPIKIVRCGKIFNCLHLSLMPFL